VISPFSELMFDGKQNLFQKWSLKRAINQGSRSGNHLVSNRSESAEDSDPKTRLLGFCYLIEIIMSREQREVLLFSNYMRSLWIHMSLAKI
jgi:hypothetical protein